MLVWHIGSLKISCAIWFVKRLNLGYTGITDLTGYLMQRGEDKLSNKKTFCKKVTPLFARRGGSKLT